MDFDLIVIGAGSGGLAAAKRSARHGAKVAIVEADRVGGTCVIRGCVPKKLLVYGSEYKELFRDAKSFGWEASEPKLHSNILLQNVRNEVNRLNQLHINLLAQANVELISGMASFSDSHTIQVGDKNYSAKNILIAVGGKPTRLQIPGGSLGWVSDDLFEQQSLPKSIVIIGAGYIACEFACILAGLGVSVTQIVRGNSILKGFDNELVLAVQAEMIEAGININFGCTPELIEHHGQGYIISCASMGSEANTSTIFEADALLQATGRLANLTDLQLAAAGVLHEFNRILVNQSQQTNIDHIYAVGDVTNRVNLTPVAVDEGRAVADRLFASGNRIVNHELIATAVFTQPEFASIGLSEEAAIKSFGSDAVKVFRAKFRSLQQALPASGPRCILKLIVDIKTDRIIGCHMVGSHAAEIIQMAAISIGMGATKKDFDNTMALHPSISEEFVTMT
ncbi:glutathione-disulfide reductase [Synechococcus lacustris]|uniref:glutathione-disulfide reductase n=1 Tax=Synechococcus lacustris TaxID=2116544 RepID=UPI0033405D4D